MAATTTGILLFFTLAMLSTNSLSQGSAMAMVNEVSALAQQAPAQSEVRVHEYPDIKALAAQDVAS